MRRTRIEALLTHTFSPAHLTLEDDSHRHAVPPGAESHFNVLVVAESFEGSTAVQRHRAVYDALRSELATGLHALKVTAWTPAEWDQRGRPGATAAPPCRGGSSADASS